MPKKVLIAADDPHITYLLQRYARQSGLEPVQTSFATAMGLLQDAQPALIIVELDSLHGSCDTLEALSKQARARSIPIVAYTSSDQQFPDPPLAIAAYLRSSVLYDDFVATLRLVGVRP